MYAALAAYNASMASYNFGANAICDIIVTVLALVQLGVCIWAMVSLWRMHRK
jgi:hypothetical protein